MMCLLRCPIQKLSPNLSILQSTFLELLLFLPYMSIISVKQMFFIFQILFSHRDFGREQHSVPNRTPFIGSTFLHFRRQSAWRISIPRTRARRERHRLHRADLETQSLRPTRRSNLRDPSEHQQEPNRFRRRTRQRRWHSERIGRNVRLCFQRKVVFDGSAHLDISSR